MRYRGGGIGHKYMREVETRCENMSLERIHGNSGSGSTRNSNTNVSVTTGGDERSGASERLHVSENTNDDESDSDDEDATPPNTDTAGGGCSTSCDRYYSNNEDLAGDTNPTVIDDDPTNDEDIGTGDSDSDSECSLVDVEVDFDEVGSDVGYESFGLAEF